MPTDRELLEAQAFGRRRLVAAFLRGAVVRDDVEPRRPGRVLAGGVAVAVLLLAGSAVVGVLTGGRGDDWLRPGLVVAAETGAAYVVTDADEPVLRPVADGTSARLVLGADLETRVVPQEEVDAQRVGDEVGIPGAPSSLSAPDRLVDSGWTACTSTGAGVRLQIAETPEAAPMPDGAVVLRVRGTDDHVLVAGSEGGLGEPEALRHALPVDADERDRFLRALGLPESAAAVEVDRGFVDLFAQGSALVRSAFGLAEEGAPVGYGDGAFAGLVVGDVVTAGGDTFLLADEGPVTLGPVAAALALAGADGPATAVASVGATVARRHPDDWPSGVLEPVGGDPCALLVTDPEAPPRVLLAVPSRLDHPAGVRAVEVEPGWGALVVDGGGGRTEAQRRWWIVDAQGVRHELAGPETLDDLGYADHPAPVVPESWLRLVECGVELSREAALDPSTAVKADCG